MTYWKGKNYIVNKNSSCQEVGRKEKKGHIGGAHIMLGQVTLQYFTGEYVP